MRRKNGIGVAARHQRDGIIVDGREKSRRTIGARAMRARGENINGVFVVFARIDGRAQTRRRKHRQVSIDVWHHQWHQWRQRAHRRARAAISMSSVFASASAAWQRGVL